MGERESSAEAVLPKQRRLRFSDVNLHSVASSIPIPFENDAPVTVDTYVRDWVQAAREKIRKCGEAITV